MALKSTERRIDELELEIASLPTLTDGDKGDITVSSSGTVWTVDTSSTRRFVTDAEKSTWNGKQDALVSGTNIKTINGNSVLGSGNIVINGNPSLGVVKGTNITGTLAVSKSASVLIPANSITQPTVLEVISRAIRVSGTGATIYHDFYINTTDSLTGATLLGTFNTITTSNTIGQGVRQLFIDTSVNQLSVIFAGVTIGADYINSLTSTITFNPANNYYIIFAVKLFNTGDTSRTQFGLIKKYV